MSKPINNYSKFTILEYVQIPKGNVIPDILIYTWFLHVGEFYSKLLVKATINTSFNTYQIREFHIPHRPEVGLPPLFVKIAQVLAQAINVNIKTDKIPCTSLNSAFSVIHEYYSFEKVFRPSVISWIKNGGNPEILLNNSNSGVISLMGISGSLNNLNFIEQLIDQGCNPNHVVFSIKNRWGKFEQLFTTLVANAVSSNNRRLLKLLIKKGVDIDTHIKWDLNQICNIPALEPKFATFPSYQPDATSFSLTPLGLAINENNLLITEDLLKAGASTNMPIFNLLTPLAFLVAQFVAQSKEEQSNTIKFIKLLLDYKADPIACPENCLISALEGAIEARQNELVKLFLEKMLARIFSPEEIRSFLEEVYFRKALGHRFGIEYQFIDFGLLESFPIPISTAGFTHESCDALYQDFYQHAELFAQKYPDSKIFTSRLKQYIDSLYAAQDSPNLLFQRIKAGELTVIAGCWLRHRVYLVCYNNTLFVCNRGTFREKGAPAGIQISTFDNPNIFSKQDLLDLISSPNRLLDEEERMKMGLAHTRSTTFIHPEQPGSFCSWSNFKLCVHLLFTLSHHDSENPLDLDLLFQTHQKIHPTYKKLMLFDRSQSRKKVAKTFLSDYEKKPDISFMLFVLMKAHSLPDSFSSWLKTQEITPEHLLAKDSSHYSLLHRARSKKNLKCLKNIAPAAWKNSSSKLFKQKTPDGVTPLYYALYFKKFSSAKWLIKEGADPNYIHKQGAFPYCLRKAIEYNDITLIDLMVKYKADFALQDRDGWNGLHFAIHYGSNQLVKYFIIMNRTTTFFNEKIKKESYLELALQKRNWKAAKKLVALIDYSDCEIRVPSALLNK